MLYLLPSLVVRKKYDLQDIFDEKIVKCYFIFLGFISIITLFIKSEFIYLTSVIDITNSLRSLVSLVVNIIIHDLEKCLNA